MEVLGQGFSTQNQGLFLTSLGTDSILTVLVPLPQRSLPKSPNHASERLSESPTLPPKVVPLERDFSELELST